MTKTSDVITARNSDGFPAPIGLAADAVVFTILAGKLAVLLARRANAPQLGEWALPGGFVGAGESPDVTIVRKLTEKTGIGPLYLEQLGTYAEPDRDERGWLPSICYLALVPAELLPEEHPNDASWTPLDELPALAFDHGTMVADALLRLRGKLWYSKVATGLLPPEFTNVEAADVYATISGVRVDASNLTRRLLAQELIEPTGAYAEATPNGGRPAKLFRFSS